jgi:hypothetical protein
MAYETSQAVKATFVAATDLTGAQYKFVEFAPVTFPEGTIVAASNGANAIGVLQNAPKAGEEAEVVLVGITKVKAADAIIAGQPVTIIAAGSLVGASSLPSGTNGYILGRALTSAQAGEIATVAISTPAANYFVD